MKAINFSRFIVFNALFLLISCNSGGSSSNTGSTGATDNYTANENARITPNSNSTSDSSQQQNKLPLECTEQKIYDNKTNSCVCPGNSVNDPLSGLCQCSEGDRFQPRVGCVHICSEDETYSAIHKQCIKKCPTGEFYDISILKCRRECIPEEVFSALEQKCIPVCKGNSYWEREKQMCVQGLPLKVGRSLDHQFLPRLLKDNSPVLKVCLKNSLYTRDFTEGEKSVIISNIKKSVMIWLEPLRKFTAHKFIEEKDIDVKVSSECLQHYDFHQPIWLMIFEIHVANGASYGIGQISMGIEEIADLPTYVHEMGHYFGFDDAYVAPNKTREDGKASACHIGYDASTTVMCVNDDHLKVADIDGIKRVYCNYYPEDLDCNKSIETLLDVETGELLKCSLGYNAGCNFYLTNHWSARTLDRKFTPAINFYNNQFTFVRDRTSDSYKERLLNGEIREMNVPDNGRFFKSIQFNNGKHHFSPEQCAELEKMDASPGRGEEIYISNNSYSSLIMDAIAMRLLSDGTITGGKDTFKNINISKEELKSLQWNLSGENISRFVVDFINNKISGEIKIDSQGKKIIDTALYDVKEDAAGTHLEWKCKINNLIKYQVTKKIKSEKYPNLILEYY
ncbi:MAG: hypothetical protein HQK52_15735 [Oligoflexia bacterium]|nr:hypothetical protein [Oligoflexia bacterium]